MRRPRTEARPRRADNAKGLTNQGPLQKGGQRRNCAVPTLYHRSRIQMVGTLRFAHPTGLSRSAPRVICFAHKRNFMQQPATNWHDGQITKNLSSPFYKNILLSFSRKSSA
jgi:hypothetical protein